MKQRLLLSLLPLLALTAAQAQFSVIASNFTPNGSSSGGSGSGVGALTVSEGSISTNNGMPMTVYTVSGLDLTSFGGSASESLEFTMTYSATTDGSTLGSPQFNSFGNVSVTGGANANQIDGTETLTATFELTSTSFAGIAMAGFTELRLGGFTAGESATISWEGGSIDLSTGANVFETPLNVAEFTIQLNSGMANFEGFRAEFTAVPEPSTFALLAGILGLGLILIRRRS